MCDLVLLCAGNSTRFKAPFKKQWTRIGEIPLWLFVARNFQKMDIFKKIFIVANEKDIKFMQNFSNDFIFIKGGDERQISLLNALNFVESEFVMVSDVARANISKKLVCDLFENLENFDCITPFLPCVDTAFLKNEKINRDDLKLIQTPQISRTKLLKKALESGEIFTDDSSAILKFGGKVNFIKGQKEAAKITTLQDLKNFNFEKTSCLNFCGNGFDVHKFGQNRDLILCGVKVPFENGLIAHSDGDVGLHALIDAIFGACSLGDIGEFYPDNLADFKDADSALLLKDCVDFVNSLGFEIVNADVTFILEKPKISSYKNEMKFKIANLLKIPPFRVNVKATTTEKLGFTGRGEGIASLASVSVKYFDYSKFL